MIKGVVRTLKEFLYKFKSNFGDVIGKYLLQCSLISVAIIVLLNIISGVEVTLLGIFEWVLSIPIFSVIVILVRMALKCVHVLLPQGGVIRLLIDIIISLVVITAVGYFMPTPESNVISTILLIIFDLLYIAIIIFLLKSKTMPEDNQLNM